MSEGKLIRKSETFQRAAEHGHGTMTVVMHEAHGYLYMVSTRLDATGEFFGSVWHETLSAAHKAFNARVTRLMRRLVAQAVEAEIAEEVRIEGLARAAGWEPAEDRGAGWVVRSATYNEAKGVGGPYRIHMSGWLAACKHDEIDTTQPRSSTIEIQANQPKAEDILREALEAAGAWIYDALGGKGRNGRAMITKIDAALARTHKTKD